MKRSLAAIFSMFLLCFLNACGGSSNAGGGGGGGGARNATHFSVTAPSAATAGTSFNITVTALNASNATVAGYSGTVHFTSSDAQAVLPIDSTLTSGTKSVLITLTTVGGQTIVATDTVTPAITGSSNSVQVTASVNLHGFHSTGDMGDERAGQTATLLTNGKVLIAGGADTSGAVATAELYDPATGKFTATGSMISARSAHTATLLAHGPAATNGKVLLIGGSSDNTAELFDLATGTFTATATPIEPPGDTATLLANGKVLIAGGVDRTAKLFDPATNSFTLTGVMTTKRDGATATLLNDGTVLITGGFDSNMDPIITAELYNPDMGTFAATGSMTVARGGYATTLLNNGKVLVTGGGFDIDGNMTTSAELYDPATGSFSPTAPMSAPHFSHTATLLNDGTVLVAGGMLIPSPPGDGSSVAEIFDSTTNTFTPTGSLLTGRFFHTATKLNNGDVLVTGGLSKATPGTILKSAELYR
jgi:WD40 repeat protein